VSEAGAERCSGDENRSALPSGHGGEGRPERISTTSRSTTRAGRLSALVEGEAAVQDEPCMGHAIGMLMAVDRRRVEPTDAMVVLVNAGAHLRVGPGGAAGSALAQPGELEANPWAHAVLQPPADRNPTRFGAHVVRADRGGSGFGDGQPRASFPRGRYVRNHAGAVVGRHSKAARSSSRAAALRVLRRE